MEEGSVTHDDTPYGNSKNTTAATDSRWHCITPTTLFITTFNIGIALGSTAGGLGLGITLDQMIAMALVRLFFCCRLAVHSLISGHAESDGFDYGSCDICI
jgi:predicted MFS family arabinose efflux permease